jgi:membrane fusion protein, multidrug efflux system
MFPAAPGSANYDSVTQEAGTPREPPQAAASSPDAPVRRRFLSRRPLIVTICVAIVVLAYLFLDYVAAYTRDAYVDTDLVAVAPQVSGPIAAVHVTDNQQVAKGDLLAAIDRSNFQLAYDLQQKVVAEAQAQVVAQQDAVATAKAQLDRANAELKLAQDNYQRASALSKTGFEAQAQLDQRNEELQVAQAALASAQAADQAAAQAVTVQTASLESEQARLALAKWALDQTELRAPVDGYVNVLRLEPGDYASEGEAIIGLVDASAWRVVANYTQHVAAMLKPGDTVWVWLDAHPFRFFKGTVQGIARAVARDPGAPQILPYVDPTTDWIRLPRRFPVRITLNDLPAGIELHSGADARAVAFGLAF